MSLLNRVKQLTWGRKIIFFMMAIIVILMVCFTALMETHYGDFTPNGNRYYHSFSLANIDWFTVTLFIGAYYLLMLPWWKFCFGNKYYFRGISIFPVKPHHTVVPGTLLTLWSVFTCGLFTFTFCLYSYLSYRKHTILLNDEYPMIVAGYVTCILFWGVVDFIYWRYFWKNNQSQSISQSPFGNHPPTPKATRPDFISYNPNK